MKVSNAVGIDLGTTYSCVAVWEGNRVEVIANDHGNRTTPSCVCLKETGRVIGDVAKSESAWNLENTIYNVKRLMGRKYEDVKADLAHWDFKVVKNQNNEQPCINVTYGNEGHQFSPEEISAMVLRYLKRMAARHMNQEDTDEMQCVITVPAHFNHTQRQATKDAATIAGLKVLQIINEPTSAALAYGMQSQNYDEKHTDHRVLVYDFGGGTFDVSILHIDQGIFTVKATGGDAHLGGEDIDANMMEYFVKTIRQNHGIDLSGNEKAKRRLKSACERAKRTLSSTFETTLDIPLFLHGEDYYTKITRNQFNEINLDLFESTMKTVKKTLADANLDKADIDEILMVGGSSRIPKIRLMLTEIFGKGPNMSVNPDEVVACGAAIHAAVLCGDLEKDDDGYQVTLRDVTPLSLGVGINGDVMSTLIQRNTHIPVQKTLPYTTARDNQEGGLLGIYQGERKRASENSLLGSITFNGLPRAPRGKTIVDVTLNLDTNGILKVMVKNEATGKSKEIQITSGSLSKREIDEMINTAAEYRLVDDAFMKKEEARKSLEDYAYETRFYPMDNQVAPRKRAVNEAVKEVLDWMDDHPYATKEEFELKKQQLENKIKKLK